MDWSTRHKVKIIGTIVSIILVITGIFVYVNFIKKDPTCTDGIMNQNEQGIDCGGVCQLVCSANIKPLIPLWTRPVKISGDVYSVVSYIENQNIGNGVKEVPYEIRLFDEKNILVSTPIIGKTFIGPNDRTAIYESAVKVGNRIPKTAFLKFLDTPKFLKIDNRYNVQNIVVENDELSDLDTMPKLTATLKNTTLTTFVSIPVVVILYDANGNIVSTSQTFIDQLDPEESETVNFTWREPFSAVPTRREIIPRLDPFIQPAVN
jgi:hypothetical protein